MDFTQELLMFQGAITSADNVHKFSRITYKGGNEEKVNIVIETIKRFLLMEKYIDENGLIDSMVPITRKFAMYIVLNADLTTLQDMMDISDIEPVIWTIPTVPKFLMCEMIWQFHMDNFIYEIIPNCWPQLGLEVADAFLINFKYFYPNDCLDKLYKLSKACYALICRLTYFTFEDDVLNTILVAANSTLENFLKCYIDPPNKHKLDTLNDDDLFKYKGKRLKSILLLVFDCCNLFSQNYNPNCDDTIYKSTHIVGYLQNTANKVCESSNKLVVECLNNSNTMILDTFKDILMDVSVDIFCAWSEYEEDGKTVQQVIGELCHKIQMKLQSINSLSEHLVMSMIKVLARKPTEIKDIINSTDTDTILQKINANDEDSSSWIHALVNKETLCLDVKLLEAVKINLKVFDDQESFILYNTVKDTTFYDVNSNGLLNDLKINLFDKCSVIDKHKILKEHFKEKIFTNNIISEQIYECKLNEIFNKFIAADVETDVDIADVLTAFYQNPKSVYTKIFSLAVQNTQLIEPMSKLMMVFKDFMEHYYSDDTSSCMIRIMDSKAVENCSHSDYRNNLLKFICKLKNLNLISSARLLMMVIMPGMHRALVNSEILQMYIQVQLLMESYTMDELIRYRAPMLVMMGQVIESVRCREVDEFQMNAVQTLEITIQFVKSIINTYQGVIPDADKNWLQYKMKELNMHPMNSYYFRLLWNLDSGNFYELVTEQPIHYKANFTVLAGNLIQVLPWAILEEWCTLWDNFKDGGLREKQVLYLFHSTVIEVCSHIETRRSENSRACLFYCYRNLVHILRYKFFTVPLTNSQVKSCLYLLTQNLDKTKPEDFGEITTIIGPLLAYLVERKNDYTVDISEYFINDGYSNLVSRFIPSGQD